MQNEPVLVSGATGSVGGRLVPLLLDSGYRSICGKTRPGCAWPFRPETSPRLPHRSKGVM